MKQTQFYFDFIPHCLDWSTMQYRWFGVIWLVRDKSQIIVDYRFEDNDEYFDHWLREGQWDDMNRIQYQAQKLYRTIRSKQQSIDWLYHE